MPFREGGKIQNLQQKLNRRAKGTARWLKENAPSCVREQKHLQEGTAERAYWHYGYLVAIQDVLKLLSRKGDNEGTSIQN